MSTMLCAIKRFKASMAGGLSGGIALLGTVLSLAGEPGTSSNASRHPEHWAFQPVSRPAQPAGRDGQWCRNLIDRFVLAKLNQAGLSPSPEADRQILIRRLFFDITGLPPTREDVAEFLADTRIDAYEKLV